MTQGLLKPHGQAISVLVRSVDLLALAGCAWLAYALRFGSVGIHAIPSVYVAVLLAGVLCAGVIFPTFGLYNSWRGLPVWKVSASTILAWGATLVALLVLLAATHTVNEISRLWLGYWSISGVIALAGVRMGVYLTLGWLRRRGYNVRRVVLFGAADLGQRLIASLGAGDWTGYKPVAVFDDDQSQAGRELGGIAVRTDTENLAEAVGALDAEEVWLALPLKAEDRVRELLHELRHTVVNVRMMPDVFGLRLLNHSVTEIAGVPTINLTESPLSGFSRIAKALEDRLLAVTILVLISPFLLVIALGIKLSSPGPVFFRQERVSWNGKPFHMLKFRSMPINAENETGAVWAWEGDSRATRFGSFLRRTSLDELPQFINVLRGDMSIVGPRPERPHFVEQFKDEIPDYMQKHLVNAGITGWAQIHGWRGNTDIRKRIEYDLYYIENWSLLFDLRIIAQTLVGAAMTHNAY